MFIILALCVLLIWIVYVTLLGPSNEEGERTRKNEGTFGQVNINAADSPSFDRQGTSREINLQRGGLMTRQSVPGQNNVAVLPRTSTGQTNATGDELIAEEEAVCRRCFSNILNEANILMMKCGCRKSFIHETCAPNQPTCDRCGQEVRRIPVTLSFMLEGRLHKRATKKSYVPRPIRKSK